MLQSEERKNKRQKGKKKHFKSCIKKNQNFHLARYKGNKNLKEIFLP